MGSEAQGTTLTLDASSVGNLTDFKIPADVRKLIDMSGLGDTREQMVVSVMAEYQVFEYEIRLDPEAAPVAIGDSGSWVATLSKQTAGSTSGKTYTFDGKCFEAGEVTGSYGKSDGLTQRFKVLCTSELTVALEA